MAQILDYNNYWGQNYQPITLSTPMWIINAVALPQEETFAQACLFAQCEGIIPAPESSHAVAEAINCAKRADAEGVSKTILFCMSGTGMMELPAYANFLKSKRA